MKIVQMCTAVCPQALPLQLYAPRMCPRHKAPRASRHRSCLPGWCWANCTIWVISRHFQHVYLWICYFAGVSEALLQNGVGSFFIFSQYPIFACITTSLHGTRGGPYKFTERVFLCELQMERRINFFRQGGISPDPSGPQGYGHGWFLLPPAPRTPMGAADVAGTASSLQLHVCSPLLQLM